MESCRLHSIPLPPWANCNSRESRPFTRTYLRLDLSRRSLSHQPPGRPKVSSLPTHSCSNIQESCSSNSIDDLRRQLEALNLEAQQARGRANAARARFMRLTETVENLRIRAITDLKCGREASARQSISEKQKVMQALDKSKQRAELLEELCNKLGEAISSKELQVMALLASTNVGLDESGSALEVRIVSPKAESVASDQAANMQETRNSTREGSSSKMEPLANCMEKDYDSMEISDQSTDVKDFLLSSRGQMYPEFMLGIDKHLHLAEADLLRFLNIAAMLVPEDADKSTKDKIFVIRQVYHDVLLARARIRNAGQQEV